MAYVTGSTSSLDDLVTALKNACTANGWTLTGNVLHNGACYVALATEKDKDGNDEQITATGGTGLDAHNALTGASPNPARMATFDYAPCAWQFPVTYYAFVFASEVYLVVRNNVRYYPWLAFGTSALPGLGGTGNWISGVYYRAGRAGNSGVKPTRWDMCYANPTYPDLCPALFSKDFFADNIAETNWIHANIGEGAAWLDAASQPFTNYLCNRQPNTWNGESLLAPIQPARMGPSNTVQYVGAALDHARYIRIDNLAPGEVIAVGSARWMVFPWWAKDTEYRDANHYSNVTGTFGHALRYEGP